jgi:hypothetical protein
LCDERDPHVGRTSPFVSSTPPSALQLLPADTVSTHAEVAARAEEGVSIGPNAGDSRLANPWQVDPGFSSMLGLDDGGGLASAPASGGCTDVHATAAHGVARPGKSVPHRDRLARSLGAEHTAMLDGIAVHDGPETQTAAAAIGAKAYAVGNDLALPPSPDLHLVAHEVAHVAQQAGGVQLAGGVGAAGDPYEQHADAVADAVVAGRSAGHLLGSTTPGARPVAVQRTEAPHAGPVGGAVGPGVGVAKHLAGEIVAILNGNLDAVSRLISYAHHTQQDMQAFRYETGAGLLDSVGLPFISDRRSDPRRLAPAIAALERARGLLAGALMAPSDADHLKAFAQKAHAALETSRDARAQLRGDDQFLARVGDSTADIGSLLTGVQTVKEIGFVAGVAAAGIAAAPAGAAWGIGLAGEAAAGVTGAVLVGGAEKAADLTDPHSLMARVKSGMVSGGLMESGGLVGRAAGELVSPLAEGLGDLFFGASSKAAPVAAEVVTSTVEAGVGNAAYAGSDALAKGEGLSAAAHAGMLAGGMGMPFGGMVGTLAAREMRPDMATIENDLEPGLGAGDASLQPSETASAPHVADHTGHAQAGAASHAEPTIDEASSAAPDSDEGTAAQGSTAPEANGSGGPGHHQAGTPSPEIPPASDATAWANRLRAELSPAELQQYELMKGKWKSAEGMMEAFGGDVTRARGEIAETLAKKAGEGAVKAAIRARSAAGVNELRSLVDEHGLMKDPAIRKELAKLERDASPAAVKQAVRKVREVIVAELRASENAARFPGSTIYREVKVWEEQATTAEEFRQMPSSKKHGLTIRADSDGVTRVYRLVTDIDTLITDSPATGSARIDRLEQEKTGVEDTAGHAERQNAAAMKALESAASGGPKVRLEIDGGIDITAKVNVVTAAGAKQSTFGPAVTEGKAYDESLKVTARDLEELVKSLVADEAKRGDVP